MEKVDFKKTYKDLYMAKYNPVIVEVPTMNFIAIDGVGSPQNEAYQKAVQALYALSYTIKMSYKSEVKIAGYFEYVVPPLEGLWSISDSMETGNTIDLSNAKWKSMIMQPQFVNEKVFEWTLTEVHRKKPDVDIKNAQLFTFTEGLCVQILHVGPYKDEERSIKKLNTFIEENGYLLDINKTRKHHEIYISDPIKTAPDKLKTILRLPIKSK